MAYIGSCVRFLGDRLNVWGVTDKRGGLAESCRLKLAATSP